MKMSKFDFAKTKTFADRQDFLSILKKIKSFGYKIYVSEDFEKDYFFNYAIISDKDKNFAIISFDIFGVKFSSCHKPNRESGAGFTLSHILTGEEISKELVDKFLKEKVPDWWKGSIPEFYKDFEEYSKTSTLKYKDITDEL